MVIGDDEAHAERAGGLQHAGMLRTADNKVPAAPRSAQNAENGEVVALRSAGSENDFVVFHADGAGKRAAAFMEDAPRFIAAFI